MGPRPDGRGIPASPPSPRSRNIRLQWGRDQMAAGSTHGQEVVVEIGSLQWGRDQMAAGSEGEAQRCFQSRSFNGAATRWPRDPFVNTEGRKKIKRLQWGRDQMAAGSAYTTPQLDVIVAPSMGPRPDGRGIGAAVPMGRSRSRPSMGPRPDGRGITLRAVQKALASAPFNGAATRWPRDPASLADFLPELADLQWGRDQMAAGSRIGAAGESYGVGLQWGRDQMAAGSGLA